MSSFRKFAIASFAVFALGTAAQAQSNGGGQGGGGGRGGGGEPGSVMNPVGSPISFVARPNNPNRGKRPGRGRAGVQIQCFGGSAVMGPARCQWN